MKHVGMSQTATPATQNDITTCFHTFKGDRLRSFPHRHSEARGKPETRDMLEHHYKHFVRDFLQFFHFVASKSMFSYEFSLEPENLQPQNRCFVGGFRQFSAHLTKCHACHGICTLSPLHAAPSHKTRLKCCACHAK